MKAPINYRQITRWEIDDSYFQNELISRGLKDQFLNALGVLLERIRDNPFLYGILTRDIRTAKIRKFPQVVYSGLSTAASWSSP